VMPPNTSDRKIIESYLMHMCEKLASRLRHHHFHAQHFFAGVKHYELGWLGSVGRTLQQTNDGKEIFDLGLFLIEQRWDQEPVYQIQVTALDPCEDGFQFDLFTQPDLKRQLVNGVMDEINDKFGEFTIAPVPLLQRSQMPNVIAPAWRPQGYRQTI
jgi:DNA polymerase-4